MGDDLIIASTTDTEAEIREALQPRVDPAPALAEVDRATGQPEPPAEAPEAEAAPEAAAAAEPGAPAPPKKSRSAERINELTREKYLAQRKAERLEAELAAYRAYQAQPPAQQYQAPPPQPQYQPPPAQVPQAPPTDAKPTVGQFSVYEDFVDALAQWNARQVARDAVGQLRAEDAMAVVQAQQQQILTQFETGKEGARQRYGDFDEVMTSEVATSMPLSEAMQHVITTSPVGHDVAYYLVQHPDEANQLVRQAPLDALRSLGRLEERLSAQLRVQYGGNGNRAPQARVTRAAMPIEPVGGTAATTGLPDDQLTYREYKAKRDREEAERRRYRR